MKKVIFLSTFLLISLSLMLLWQKISGGFRLDKIYPYEFICQKKPIDHSYTPPDPKNFLRQKFHYLGKGCQVYVFESEDKKRVLKLARLSRYRLPFWQKILKNISFTHDYVLDRKNYHQRMFDMAKTSYKLAYDRLKEETALEFVSINRNSEEKFGATLEDDLYRKQRVDLNQTLFVIQKKAIPLDQVLLDIKKDQDYERLQTLLKEYFDTILSMVEKKITNKDYNCIKNLGVLDHHVIFTDVGSFVSAPDFDPRKNVERVTRYFYKWARAHFQEAIPYFDKAKSLALKKFEKMA